MSDTIINQRENGRRELALLVAAFRDHVTEYRRAGSDYNETQLRTDFLDPLLRALGWDVDNRRRLPQDLRDVVQEATVEVSEEEQSKKPDYALRAGRVYKFFLEAKKPSVRVGEDQAATFQARRYGFSASHPITVLSNFDQTIIYRTIEPPNVDVAPREGVIARYGFEELLTKFDEVYDALSREAVYGGNFDKTFAADAPLTGYQQFDAYFLKQIESWRERLASDIGRRNTAVSAHELNFFVQRILNRIIFLRICEDRHLERYESLRRLGKNATYDDLKHLFEHADTRYNSGLFNLLEDPTLSLSIDNAVLHSILEELYYPKSPYTFAVVDAGVLGAIYDQFLTKQVEFAEGRTVVLNDKPEVRLSGGVFVTPRDIAGEIVRRTLEPLAQGKGAESLFRLRIADIACGSGVFLLSAFEYLQNRLIDAYLADGVEKHVGEHIYESGNGQWRLTLAEKRKLLLQCIFGVDIDDQAAEVARFGLLLKTIEDEGDASISAHLAQSGERALPSLSGNLKCGNSLVDGTSFRAFIPAPTDEQWNQANPFEWRDEFPDVIREEGGFSAIVGNPPYVRIQRLVQYSPDEASFYRSPMSKYATAQHDNFDKYFLFIERAIKLLRPGGRLGFIVPHKFMVLKSGSALRELIANQNLLREIVHFGVHQVFLTSTTYTCLIFLERSEARQFTFEHVRSLAEWRIGVGSDRVTLETSKLTSEPWVFAPKAWDEVFSRLRSSTTHKLLDVADVFVGVQTSADKIYIIRPTGQTETLITFEDVNHRTWSIERGILRPCLYDARIEPFSEPIPNAFIIFPYLDGGQAIPSAQMHRDFPRTLAYLTAHKVKLAARSMQAGHVDEWYRYGRSQGLTRFATEKIILPTLAIGPTYSLDRKGTIVTGGGNGPYYLVRPKAVPGWSSEFILALLSYPVLEAMVRASSTTFRGGYYSRSKQFLEPLPMPTLNISTQADRAKHDGIVQKVRELISLTNVRDWSSRNYMRFSTQCTACCRTLDETFRRLSMTLMRKTATYEDRAISSET
jgi:type I restriction-modification system DNA methylase subunit